MDVLSVSELEDNPCAKISTEQSARLCERKSSQNKEPIGRRLEAVLQYEVRGDLAVNIDYVIAFDDSIRLDD